MILLYRKFTVQVSRKKTFVVFGRYLLVFWQDHYTVCYLCLSEWPKALDYPECSFHPSLRVFVSNFMTSWTPCFQEEARTSLAQEPSLLDFGRPRQLSIPTYRHLSPFHNNHLHQMFCFHMLLQCMAMTLCCPGCSLHKLIHVNSYFRISKYHNILYMFEYRIDHSFFWEHDYTTWKQRQWTIFFSK